mmetsp:Transcript_35669/g.55698  ORF Transcript_35669/g.55698 Transcript_35669/m.55698 type:complete len:308 (+) Transcript_35669:860-1783(+)
MFGIICLKILKVILPLSLSFFLSSPQQHHKRERKKTEIFFEKYDVPSFCLLPDCVLSLYGCGKETGLVVDVGRSYTRITPVLCGFLLRQSQKLLPVGSSTLIDYLQSLVVQLDKRARAVPSFEFDNYLRQRCYFPLDFSEEFKRTEDQEITKRYNLFQIGQKTKHAVDLKKIRFSATEPLFKPPMVGMSESGLPQSIKTVLEGLQVGQVEGEVEGGIEKQMINNILLTGGGSNIFGLHSRLEMSLLSLYQDSPLQKDIHVIAQEGRELDTWRGGRVVSHFAEFSKMTISHKEFQEVGPKIVNWMCPQ